MNSLLLFLITGSICAACQLNPANRDTRVGTNLASIGASSTEIPFSNLFRQARPEWISFVDGEGWTDGRDVALDGNGWVSSLEEDQAARKLIWWEVPAGAVPAGEYTIQYKGSGVIRYMVDFAAPTVLESVRGRDIIDVPEGSQFMSVEILATDPADPIRNIEVLLAGGVCQRLDTFELQIFTRVDAPGDCPAGTTFQPFDFLQDYMPFNPDFLQRMSHYSVIRPMDSLETNSSEVVTWQDRAKITDATWSTDAGIPPEVLIQLAVLLQADLWYTVPHQADDDYIRNLGTFARSTFDRSLDIYLELSNEVWATNFLQHFYANSQGFAQGLYPEDDPTTTGDDFIAGARWYAKRSGEMFDAFDAAFGRPSIHVLGTQAVNTFLSRVILDFDPAVTAKTDVLAIAPYFIDGDETLLQGSIDAHFDAVSADAIPEILGSIQAQYDVATEYGLELASYEGGQSLGRFFPSTPENSARYDEMNRHPRMFDMYDQYMTGWTNITCANDQPGLFMHYLSVSRYTVFGKFGSLEHLYQTELEPAPKHDLLVNFSRRLHDCP